MATPTYPETPALKAGTFVEKAVPGGALTNVTESSIAKIPEIDFVGQFGEGIRKLQQALGLTRNLPLPVGGVIRRYAWNTGGKNPEAQLASGDVPEGDLIPLTSVALKELDSITVDIKKYRKQVTAELIQLVGPEVAIAQSDTQFLRLIQKSIRKDFFSYLASDAVAPKYAVGDDYGYGLQAAFAVAKAELDTLFEDNGDENVIVLINPIDQGKYLGQASLTTNTAFGMNYLVPFAGVTVLPFTDVPVGTAYATVASNIILAHADVRGALNSVFNLTTDETGLIGINHMAHLDRFAYDTVAATSVKLLAEIPAGVVKIAIPVKPEAPEVPAEG